jgi:hypothetical protein
MTIQTGNEWTKNHPEAWPRLNKYGSSFHWRDGWFFTRLPGGYVEIRNHGTYETREPGKSGAITLTIPAAEWASIVCSVSHEGETGERFSHALGFHGAD